MTEEKLAKGYNPVTGQYDLSKGQRVPAGELYPAVHGIPISSVYNRCA